MTTAEAVSYAGATLGGCLVAVHLVRPRAKCAHWAFVGGMALLAAEAVFDLKCERAVSVEDLLRFERMRLALLSAIPGIWIVFSLMFARGNAREHLRKWAAVIAAFLVLPPLVAFVYRKQVVTGAVWSEGDSHYLITLGWAGLALNLAVLVGSVIVIMNLERTFRATVGIMRWRIKFMLLGVGVLFLARIYTTSQSLLFRGFELPLQSVNSGALLIASLLIALSVVRSGAFDVDVYPSQAVLKNSVTVTLAGIYLVIVGTLAKVTTYIGGDASFALKAFVMLMAVVGIAVVLQSDRARLRLRQFLSRNFERPLYDYRSVWMKFTAASASRFDELDLSRSLSRLTADMFQALSVAIWVVAEDGKRLELSASTFLSEAKAPGLDLEAPGGQGLLELLRARKEPIDFEGPDAPWAVALRALHPSQFVNGGHRVCIPLAVQGEVVGLMTVGDRVGGAVFTLQDLDMLRCAGDHVTAALRNVRLSQKLLQAKELEAFQTMATFFVHDLKNAASTLNLMLQNLPEHYDDPEFREDSLRGISKTVNHINRLTGRLSLLRHEQKLEAADIDLNELVKGCLAELEQGVGGMLQKELGSVPRVSLDREQFAKVVTNLVLNATEAVGKEGRVRVTTGTESSSVVLTVSDNGCGMTPEFMSRGLFRPFQTTKKSGLGIGMFQSKMIVEAHGGRIAVASAPGEGTTFRVFLPIPPTRP